MCWLRALAGTECDRRRARGRTAGRCPSRPLDGLATSRAAVGAAWGGRQKWGIKCRGRPQERSSQLRKREAGGLLALYSHLKAAGLGGDVRICIPSRARLYLTDAAGWAWNESEHVRARARNRRPLPSRTGRDVMGLALGLTWAVVFPFAPKTSARKTVAGVVIRVGWCRSRSAYFELLAYVLAHLPPQVEAPAAGWRAGDCSQPCRPGAARRVVSSQSPPRRPASAEASRAFLS